MDEELLTTTRLSVSVTVCGSLWKRMGVCGRVLMRDVVKKKLRKLLPVTDLA